MAADIPGMVVRVVQGVDQVLTQALVGRLVRDRVEAHQHVLFDGEFGVFVVDLLHQFLVGVGGFVVAFLENRHHVVEGNRHRAQEQGLFAGGVKLHHGGALPVAEDVAVHDPVPDAFPADDVEVRDVAGAGEEFRLGRLRRVGAVDDLDAFVLAGQLFKPLEDFFLAGFLQVDVAHDHVPVALDQRDFGFRFARVREGGDEEQGFFIRIQAVAGEELLPAEGGFAEFRAVEVQGQVATDAGFVRGEAKALHQVIAVVFAPADVADLQAFAAEIPAGLDLAVGHHVDQHLFPLQVHHLVELQGLLAGEEGIGFAGVAGGDHDHLGAVFRRPVIHGVPGVDVAHPVAFLFEVGAQEADAVEFAVAHLVGEEEIHVADD